CALLPSDNLVAACAIYIVGLFGFHAANIFYDSLLPGIVSSNEQADTVSAMGFAAGSADVPVSVPDRAEGEAEGSDSTEVTSESKQSFWSVLKFSLVEVVDTFKQVKLLSNCALFLLAYFLYIDGADTIISMAIDIGMSLGFPAESLIIVLLMVQFIGMPMTLLFTKLVSKIGPKKGVILCCAGYLLVVALGTFMSNVVWFYVLGALVACVQGPIQALSRSLFTRLVPADCEGRFFGLYNIIGKFSTIIGPLLIGVITSVTGSTRLSVASLSILFIGGGGVLLLVDFDEGAKQALAYRVVSPGMKGKEAQKEEEGEGERSSVDEGESGDTAPVVISTNVYLT
ncbi:autophagy-related protein 22-like, partial [Kipferlia bialata]